MSKMSRTVSGQTIVFTALPRIFQSLASDLPTGAIRLATGETAYWRLNRNLNELKNNRFNQAEIAANLAAALRVIATSEEFKNHYGLTKAPELPNEKNLTATFRALLQLNNTRVEYNSTYFGRNMPTIETISIPLSNMVFLNATRGANTPGPKQAGLKGTLWLNGKQGVGKPFTFTIVSPHVKLQNHINDARLRTEILLKIGQNLGIMSTNPEIEFDDGQFDEFNENYITNGVASLAEKHPHAPNGNGKKQKKSALTSKAAGKEEAPSAEDVAQSAVIKKAAADRAVIDLLQTGETGKLETETQHAPAGGDDDKVDEAFAGVFRNDNPTAPMEETEVAADAGEELPGDPSGTDAPLGKTEPSPSVPE